MNRSGVGPAFGRGDRFVDTVVFDLDGTLVDTVGGITSALNHALREHRIAPLSRAEVRGQVGLGGTALVRLALRKAGRAETPEEVTRLQRDYLTAYASAPDHDSRPYPGTRELLERLREAGVRIALCTNKAGGVTSGLLSALELHHYFHAVVTGDTLPVRKPDPRPLLHAARIAGGAPRTLMVGDSVNDVQAARAAGVPVACVTFGYHEGPEWPAAPDFFIDSFAVFAESVAEGGVRWAARDE